VGVTLVVEGEPDGVPINGPVIADQVPPDDIIFISAACDFDVIELIKIGSVVVYMIVIVDLSLEGEVVKDHLLPAEVYAPILIFGDPVKDL
jgi:hypothetical protein